MSSSDNVSIWSSPGVQVTTTLVVLKALGLVSWSWWWCPVPILMAEAIGICLAVAITLFRGENGPR